MRFSENPQRARACERKFDPEYGGIIVIWVYFENELSMIVMKGWTTWYDMWRYISIYSGNIARDIVDGAIFALRQWLVLLSTNSVMPFTCSTKVNDMHDARGRECRLDFFFCFFPGREKELEFGSVCQLGFGCLLSLLLKIFEKKNEEIETCRWLVRGVCGNL